MIHHEIVALEGVHVPIPSFTLPHPHTHNLTVYQRTSQRELPDRVKDATILILSICSITAETLSPAITPNLQHIAIMAAGTDSVDLEACQKRGIRVTNCAGANVETVAEHTLGLYFAARRRTVLMHERTVAGREWKDKGTLSPYMRVSGGLPPLSCRQEVLGIVGNGKIGSRVAHLCQMLGMRVLTSARKGGLPSDGRTPFEEVLRTATVLVLCLPRTRDTLNLISTSELAAMRPESIIINVSRGGIADEESVFAALKAGQIAGYATDVLAAEPSVGGEDPSSSLLSKEAQGLNITISPHLAWFGQATMENYQKMLKENIEGWCVGIERNVVV